MPSNRTFTTYFKGEVDTSVESKINAQAATVVSAYDKMTAAATRATQAAQLIGGSGSGGLNTSRALTAQADAQRRVADTSLAAATSVQRFTAANTIAGRSLTTVAAQNDVLASSLARTSTALGVIQGPLGPIAGRVRALSGALKEFSVSSLGLVGVGAALFGIVSLGNQFTAVQTKLRPFFETQQATNEALADVVGIANRARSALDPIADLYVRLTTLQNEFKPGTNIAQLSETIAKASTLSGGSAENQAEGIRQLTQGLGRGILNGQDLRALEEDSFNLAKTIADGLGVNVGKLKQLGQEGKLTTDVVVQALQREQYIVEAQFSRLPVTLSSASREFKNALVTFVGGTDQALGLTHGLAEALQAVATNIRPIAVAGAALAAAFAVPKAANTLLAYFDSVATKLALQRTLTQQTNDAIQAGTAFRTTEEGKAAALAVAELEEAQAAKAAADARLAAASSDAELSKESFTNSRQRLADLQALKAATIDEAAEAVSAAEAEVATKKAVLDQLAEEIVQRERLALSYERARPLLENTVATQPTNVPAQEELASQTALAAENQIALSKAETLAVPASLDLVAAQNDLTVALEAQAAAAADAVAIDTQIVAASKDATAARINYSAANSDATAATLTIAEAETVLEEKTVAATAAVEAGKVAQSGLGAALSTGIGLIFNWQTAIFAVTAAVVAYASQTSNLDDALSHLTDTQRAALQGTKDQADALEKLGQAGVQAAIGIAQANLAQAKQAVQDQRNRVASSIEGRASVFRGGLAVAPELGDIAQGVRTGTIDPAVGLQQANTLNPVAQRANSNVADSVLGFFGVTSSQRGNAALADYATSVQVLTDSEANLKKVQDDLAVSGKQSAIVLGQQSSSIKDLQDNAKSLVDTGKATVDENNKFAASVDALNKKFNVSKGKIGEDGTAGTDSVPGGDEAAQAYQRQYQALYAAHEQRLKSIQEERTASHAAAQEAKQDALGDLEASTLNQLIDLEKRKSSLTQDEYDAQRIAIKKRYDDEKAQIDATGSRSNSALKQELADIEAVAKAAEEAGNKRDTILGRYSSQPKPEIQRQQDLADLRKNVGKEVEFKRGDATSVRVYTEADFEADSKQLDAVGRELTKFYDQQRQNNVVSALQASGQDAIASAVQKAFELEQQYGSVSEDRLADLVREYEEQEKINDLLSARKQITDTILGVTQQTKDALTSLLSGQSTLPQFGKTLVQNFRNAQASITTTSLFQGVDPQIKQLFAPSSPIDQAKQAFADGITSTTSSVSGFTSAVDTTVSATERLSSALDTLAGHVTAAASGSSGLSTLTDTLTSPSLGLPAAADQKLSLSDDTINTLLSLNGGSADGANSAIVVNAKQQTQQLTGITGLLTGQAKSTVTLTAAYNKLGETLGGKLDAIIDPQGGVFAKLGGQLGNALQGASIGATTGSLIFGSNQSSAGKIGDSIGGAIGDVAGTALKGTITSGLSSALGSAAGAALGAAVPVIGSIIGSVAGGLLGSLFKKTKYGGDSVTVDSNGNLAAGTAFGNNSTAKSNSTTAAGQVATELTQITSALGATINPAKVVIGTYNGNYRVQTDGSNHLGGANHGAADAVNFGKDGADAAVAYAVQQEIEKSVITGISQASINILKSGQDLQTAIEKATTIEGIPKQLEQLTDPVKYAVDTLNDQFKTVIADLNEGGATAAQYAQAQQLYDLQRAQAISQAAKSVFGTVEDYIQSLTDSSDSPLNKPTTYANAQSTFAGLAAQIDAGQLVDQDALVTAAKNLMSASQSVNGSNTSFFDDYNRILAELNKADATATSGTDTSSTSADSIASPFATDATAAAALASLKNQGTVDSQTSTAAIVSAVNGVQTTLANLINGSGSGSAIGRLVGFQL